MRVMGRADAVNKPRQVDPTVAQTGLPNSRPPMDGGHKVRSYALSALRRVGCDPRSISNVNWEGATR